MKNNYPIWLKGNAILLGVILIFVVLHFGKFILMPLAFSALIAMLLEPVSTWLERYKFNRIAAIITSMVVIALILGGIMSLFSIQLVQFADRLPEANEKLQSLSGDITQFFENTFSIAPERQIQFVERGLETVIDKSGDYMSTALDATTSVFTTLALMPIFVFFMMYYKKMYRHFLHNSVEGKNNIIDALIDSIQGVAQNYVVGMMMVITILVFLNALGLWILGIDHALFFAVFSAILAIIPYIGIIIQKPSG